MADETNQMPIPPADFFFLVESLLVQAQIHLGLMFGEGEESSKPNLPLARHSIDMLAMLEEKTKGNLTIKEQRLLENGLTELRFRFVQVSERVKEPTQSSLTTPEEEKKDAPRIILGEGGKGTKSV
jgi:Domain of unknown function (DUF1844)